MKTKAWQTSGTLTMVTSCVTQCWCFPICKRFDIANAKIGAERNHQKAEVKDYLSGPDTASPNWKITEVRPLASVDTEFRRGVTRSRSGTSPLCHRSTLGRKQTSPGPCMNACNLCQDPQTEFALLRESLGVSRITSSECIARVYQ